MPNWEVRLRYALRNRKLSQRSLAEVLGVTPQAVGKWFKGGDIEHAKLRQLAKLLGVNWVWLRYGEDALKESLVQQSVEDRVSHLRETVAKEALHSEERHRAICVALKLGVWEVNPNIGKNFWSITTRQILGAPLDLQPSQSVFRDLVYDEDVPHIDETIKRAVTGDADKLEQRFRLKSDPDKWIRCTGTVFKNGDRVERVAGIMFEDGHLLPR